MAQAHPPGVFELQIDKEPIDVTWEAYHTTMTLLLSSNGRTEAWPVSREEFEKTLAPSMTLGQPRDLSDPSNLQRRKIFSCKPDLSQQRQDTNDKVRP